MEDILAVVVVLALVVAFSFGLKAIIRGVAEKKAEQKRKQEESDKFWESERLRTRKIAQERTLARMAYTNTPPPKQREFVKRDASFGVARGSELTVTHAQSPTQSVSSYQDNFLSDVVTAVAINSLLTTTHKSGGSNPIDFPKEERSVGVSKSESSWGFDDSDSRKSVSSSMDTSSSWSSSSSSSSSDSGPSSDW
jgi:hypothetical protein